MRGDHKEEMEEHVYKLGTFQFSVSRLELKKYSVDMFRDMNLLIDRDLTSIFVRHTLRHSLISHVNKNFAFDECITTTAVLY